MTLDRFVKVSVDKNIEPETVLARLGISDTIYVDTQGNIFFKNWKEEDVCYDTMGNTYALLDGDAGQNFYKGHERLIEVRKQEIRDLEKS